VKIPISNLFYLLCYAWDILDSAEEVEVGDTDAPDLENLAARVLGDGLERLLRFGLERDYVELREDSNTIRGRIDFQRTIKTLMHMRQKAHVSREDLFPDIPSNQILKASIANLLKFKTLDKQNRERIAGLYLALRGVAEIRLSSSAFGRLRMHRNNRHYKVLLSICEMLHRYSIPDEKGEGMRFIRFEHDGVKMRKIFQSFVTNFYRRRQDLFSVSPERFPWQGSAPHHGADIGLPGLHTDVVLSNAVKKIVIETKFVPNPFLVRYGKTMLRPSHVNQAFAYMQNVEAKDKGTRKVEGMLLYPAVTDSFCLKWTLFGKSLTSAAVDLRNNWRQIESELLSFIGVPKDIS
jgi:5-methylcytosine-specific restriction enzyme subunit McrC